MTEEKANESEKEETHIAIFSGKKIRRKLVDNKWFFSVVDIVGVLTESENPRDYWYKLKIREQESSGIELSTFCRELKLLEEYDRTHKLLKLKKPRN